jgi:cell wall-associated NlpC family hydrolase
MTRGFARLLGAFALAAAVLLAAGCAQQPSRPAGGETPGAAEPAKPEPPEEAPRTVGQQAAFGALAQLGAPYKFGGSDPAGFDCSGMVRYVYRHAAVQLPRDTRDQRKTVPLLKEGSELKPGDLLFYWRTSKRKELHVGVYVGGGEFVHAPSSGGAVRKDKLGDKYWRTLFIEAHRLANADARAPSR